MFKIEQNVPIVSKRDKKECPYPFASMEKGDSFFVEATLSDIAGKRASVSNWAARYRRMTRQFGFSISTRTVDGGFRVWRIN